RGAFLCGVSLCTTVFSVFELLKTKPQSARSFTEKSHRGKLGFQKSPPKYRDERPMMMAHEPLAAAS
ncbi:MAG TPA: hypothetical protein VLW06_08485, partial [Terriglobales bacterium]|nr:hypothetical protein [Terriglobales bacterium]